MNVSVKPSPVHARLTARGIVILGGLEEFALCDGYIMDFTPRYTDTTGTREMQLGEWIFDPVNSLPKLCLMLVCP